eukprot:gene11013-12177_t
MENSVARQKYTYPEGDVYDGFWNKEGKKHGLGVLNLTDGSKYVGKFLDGLFDGLGVLTFADGTTFQGEFSRGKYNGYGVYMRCDKMQFEGKFSEGKVNGPGLITFPDQSHGRPRNEGIFEGTKLLKREKVPEAIEKAQIAADRARKLKLP